MAQVLLRDYVAEMRQHLRAGQYSDAVALGHHILRYYPKHLDTYRALGEVSLDTNDLKTATDLFQRVLSADPENVVAFVGLSIAYEHQNQLEEAIWHLERAFEIQPSNPELRSELLRLYAKHEGKPRARLKLTPGALARLYARQGLYPQAIQEFRALLRTDPTRYDLQVALTETLYRGGRRQEAAAMAQALLEKLPFCLKANLLLGTLWQENDVPEAEVLLQRAQSVDPERTVARELLVDHWAEATAPTLPPIGSEPAPPVIDLQLLAEPSPVQEPVDLTESRPPTPEAPAPEPPAVPTPAQEQAPELPPQPTAPVEELPHAPVPPTTTQDQVVVPPQEEVVKPPPPIEQKPAVELAPTPRVHPSLPKTPPNIPGALEKLPAWLRAAITPAVPSVLPPQPAPGPAAPEVKPKEPPPTVAAPVAPAPEPEVPEWLTRIRQGPRPAETEVSAPLQETKPEWLIEAEKQSTAAAPTTETGGELPDWLTVDLTQVGMQPTSIEPETLVPDWLAPAEPEAQPEAPAATVEEHPAASDAPVEAQAGESSVPSWLENLGAAEAAAESQVPDSSVPSWLQSAVPSADVPAPVESDETIPDWLLRPQVEQPRAADVATTPTEPATESTAQATPVAEPAEVEPAEPPAVEPRAVAPASPEAAGSLTGTAETPASVPVAEQPEAKPKPVADPETMLVQARELYAQGNGIAAIDLYEKVLQRGARFIPSVITDLEELIKDPNAPLPAHRLLGDAYSMVGRFKEALEQYRLVLGR